MIRFWPSMTTTVSSDSEIGLKYGYSPWALISSARVNFRHFSNSEMSVAVVVGVDTRKPRRFESDWIVTSDPVAQQ